MKKIAIVMLSICAAVGLGLLVKLGWLSWDHADMTQRELFIEYPGLHISVIALLFGSAIGLFWVHEED